MPKEVHFKQIFDQNDDAMMRELVIRLGSRLHAFSDGELAVMLCVPIAIQMLQGYLAGALHQACENGGIDITKTPVVEGEGYDIKLSLTRRH